MHDLYISEIVHPSCRKIRALPIPVVLLHGQRESARLLLAGPDHQHQKTVVFHLNDGLMDAPAYVFFPRHYDVKLLITAKDNTS